MSCTVSAVPVSIPNAAIFVVAVALSKAIPNGLQTCMAQSWVAGGTEDEAVGRAVKFAAEAAPDFKIDQWVVTEIPASGMEAEGQDTEGWPDAKHDSPTVEDGGAHTSGSPKPSRDIGEVRP